MLTFIKIRWVELEYSEGVVEIEQLSGHWLVVCLEMFNQGSLVSVQEDSLSCFVDVGTMARNPSLEFTGGLSCILFLANETIGAVYEHFGLTISRRCFVLFSCMLGQWDLMKLTVTLVAYMI